LRECWRRRGVDRGGVETCDSAANGVVVRDMQLRRGEGSSNKGTRKEKEAMTSVWLCKSACVVGEAYLRRDKYVWKRNRVRQGGTNYLGWKGKQRSRPSPNRVPCAAMTSVPLPKLDTRESSTVPLGDDDVDETS
jgi:hypothetical protein